LAWSTSFAASKDLMNHLGVFLAPAIGYTTSGIFSLLLLIRRGQLRSVFSLPKNYLWICGGLFVLYMLALYVAVGLSPEPKEMVEVSILNYLWPGLTLVFSIPILKNRWRPFILIPGVLIAFLGIYFTMLGDVEQSLAGVVVAGGRFLDKAMTHKFIFSLGLVAAVTWALYSNLVRKFAANVKGDAVVLFLLVSGLCFWGCWGLQEAGVIFQSTVKPHILFDGKTALEMLYVILIPSLAAYTAWEYGMRKGQATLITTVSYFTPLMSAMISCFWFDLQVTWTLVAGCVLVIVGASLSKFGVIEAEKVAEEGK